jgi:MerR family copper efflux transcriptional regulator
VRIKEVEELVGVTKKNIRFYEKEGLLSPGRESENSYRDYDMKDVRRLRFIKLLRKLDMPIGDIKCVLEGKTPLPEAVRSHIAVLDGRMRSLSMAKSVCSELPGSMDELEAENLLRKLSEMEKEGAIFVDVKKYDVRQQYLGSIAASVVVVLFMAGMIWFFLSMNKVSPAPTALTVTFIAIYVLIALGTIGALIFRIREIKGGEYDDLSNY